jgi:flagellin
MQKAMLQIASGYRINSAADDAAGLAISERMRAQIAGLNQAVRNANDGMSMIQTYEGALTETHSILNRMKTLATQAANGTYTDETDRASIELEYEELLKELNDIADTDFNGITALDGGTSALKHIDDLSLQLGSRSKDLKKFDFDYSSAWNTFDDPAAARNSSIGTLTPDMNATAAGLGLNSATVNLASQANANKAIDVIDKAINKVSMIRASFGAIQNRLEHKVNNLNTTSENLSDAESRIRDTDLAAATLEFAKAQIQFQATQAVLGMIMKNAYWILELLK